MRITTKNYCGQCRQEFLRVENVWYVPIENDVFCGNCAYKIDAERQPALYVESDMIEPLILDLINKYEDQFSYADRVKMMNRIIDRLVG